jgi:hypothetical protein
MYCNSCGNQIADDAVFCPVCGNRTVLAGKGGNIGYSPLINDPAFDSYAKQSHTWSLLFAVILAVIAIIGFYIYGATSSEMDNPQALYIGLGIGGMFIVIALIQIISRKTDKDWDAVVVDKKQELKREKKYHGNDRESGWYWQEYMEFTVVLRKQDGKLINNSVRDDDTKYNYYKIGDHVRHHGKLHSLEKYDKSNDTIIFCNACGYLNEISDDKCVRCGCPLLK